MWLLTSSTRSSGSERGCGEAGVPQGLAKVMTGGKSVFGGIKSQADVSLSSRKWNSTRMRLRCLLQLVCVHLTCTSLLSVAVCVRGGQHLCGCVCVHTCRIACLSFLCFVLCCISFCLPTSPSLPLLCLSGSFCTALCRLCVRVGPRASSLFTESEVRFSLLLFASFWSSFFFMVFYSSLSR